MAQAALKEIPVQTVVSAASVSGIRRFELPDIDRHGAWIMKRLIAAYPHLNERQAIGWLRSLIYNNEFLFLYQEHSVGLAQAVRADALTPSTTIWEKFVWAKDPRNPEHVGEASLFYERFKDWAKHQDASAIVVAEQTDVPQELIKQRIGALLERKQTYSRV